jgi:SAM-dependent methyltransferase
VTTQAGERSGNAQSLAVRMFLAMLAAQELLTAYLATRLGLYETLARDGPGTVLQIVERTGIAPRYARELLEQQTVAGFIAVDEPAKHAQERVYSLPPGHEEVMIASAKPTSMIALTTLPLGGIARALPQLLAAYRTGAGVCDAEFGEDWRDGHSGANRALFTHLLPHWIRETLPQVHERLNMGGTVADVACGAAFASIGLALAYPKIHVYGLDVDAATVDRARRNVSMAGVADRIEVDVRDAADPRLRGSYDLVCLFDALHELAQPVEVLRACRRLRAEHGHVLVMDAKVATTFHAPADEIERFQYATSVLHCLPACLAQQPSAGTGTVMRVGTVRDFAQAAGFASLRLLPVEDRFHRLYHLAG